MTPPGGSSLNDNNGARPVPQVPSFTPSRKKKPPKEGVAPLAIVKKSEDDLEAWLSSPAGFMEAHSEYAGEPLHLEDYQIQFLSTDAHWRSVEKSRQTGYSFVMAVESVALAHLRDQHTSIFVSYNLADAKEKILYCQQLHESLPLSFQKKIVIDSKLEIGFQSNNANKRISRIISNPSKAPRGKNGDIYLDEFAHVKNDKEIYDGSTALIMRSGGRLTICSSPLGRRGRFWEVARQELKKYPTFWRQRVPWWLCSFFCTDVLKAAINAPTLPTAERVARYGKTNIREQFAAMDLDAFQQEFEVYYADESQSFFPFDMILPCTFDEDELPLCEDVSELAAIDEPLFAGYDVGRRKDLSCLAVGSIKNEVFRTRMLVTYEKMPFEEQQDKLSRLLELPNIRRLSIDANGIGMQLAENLGATDDRVVAETFGARTKELWATDFKIRLQKKQLRLPRDRSLVNEIHAVKKLVSHAGVVMFDIESGATAGFKGHGDRFWALALAAQKDRKPPPKAEPPEVRVLALVA